MPVLGSFFSLDWEADYLLKNVFSLRSIQVFNPFFQLSIRLYCYIRYIHCDWQCCVSTAFHSLSVAPAIGNSVYVLPIRKWTPIGPFQIKPHFSFIWDSQLMNKQSILREVDPEVLDFITKHPPETVEEATDTVNAVTALGLLSQLRLYFVFSWGIRGSGCCLWNRV